MFVFFVRTISRWSKTLQKYSIANVTLVTQKPPTYSKQLVWKCEYEMIHLKRRITENKPVSVNTDTMIIKCVILVTGFSLAMNK